METGQPLRARHESLCPCKSRKTYGDCCEPFHLRKAEPDTAEQLMRARYSAYFFRLPAYIVDTTHPDTKTPGLLEELRQSIDGPKWTFLTVVHVSKGQTYDKVGKVEFTADCYLDGELQQLHECSRFKRYKGRWKYLDDKG